VDGPRLRHRVPSPVFTTVWLPAVRPFRFVTVSFPPCAILVYSWFFVSLVSPVRPAAVVSTSTVFLPSFLSFLSFSLPLLIDTAEALSLSLPFLPFPSMAFGEVLPGLISAPSMGMPLPPYSPRLVNRLSDERWPCPEHSDDLPRCCLRLRVLFCLMARIDLAP